MFEHVVALYIQLGLVAETDVHVALEFTLTN